MQVSVERTSELERKITVQLPEETIKEKMETRLQDLAKGAKIDGFRPGKVPQRVIRNRFGKRVREEVVGELVKASFYDAISEEKLNPVGGPLITPEKLAEGEGIKYTASFEVYPEIELTPLTELEIKRPVSEVADADLEAMIDNLRAQKKSWKTVDRSAQNDDRVTINFTGLADGEDLTDGGVKDHPLILGSKTMIPGFEEKLVGIAAGETIDVELEFPSDYSAEKLAGKTANFEIEVLKVEEAELPDLDDEFIKGFGIESGEPEAFREEIKGNMERELNNVIRGKVKTAVMDALVEKHDINLPRVLIDQEIEQLSTSYKNAAASKNQNEVQQMPKEILEKQAVRRVKLGLILREIIKGNDLKPDKERVRSTIESLAQSYQDPNEVVNWYYSKPEQLHQIEQMVLEDQVVDWVVEQSQLKDEETDFSELMQPHLGGLQQG